MNIEQFTLDSDWRAALRAIGKKRIEILFDEIKLVELARIEHVAEKELTGIQARVKLITELKDLFLQVKPASKTNPEPDDD